MVKQGRTTSNGWIGRKLVVLALAGIALLAARVGFTESAPSLAWARRHGNPGGARDVPKSIATRDGSVYVGGFSDGPGGTSDFVLIKYAPDGTEAWIRYYDGPAHNDDQLQAMALDAAGNIYVAGECYSTLAFDYALVKYDAAGNELWARRIERPDAWSGGTPPLSLAVAPTGHAYLVGTQLQDTNRNYLVMRYDPNGDLEWTRTYDGGAGDAATAAAMDSAGNLCVTGYSYSTDDSTYDYATLSYGPDGAVRWLRKYSNGQATGIAADANGNVYVTGASNGFVTVSYDMDGGERWAQRFSGTGTYTEGPRSIACSPAGQVFLAGSSYTGSDSVGKLVSYSPNGTELWVKTQFYWGVAVTVDSSGATYFLGAVLYDPSYSLFEVGIAKYLSNGTAAWEKRWHTPAPGMLSDERTEALTVDGSGNVYVTSTSWLSDTFVVPAFRGETYEIATEKFSQVAPDTTPPGCRVLAPVSESSPVRVYAPVQFTDAGSGVAKVELTANSTNCTLQYPLGTVAGNNPTTGLPTLTLDGPLATLTVYAVKVNPSRSARVELRVTDAAGNSVVCDPVVATLEIPKGRKSITRTFKALPAIEHFLRLENGTPGLRQVGVSVNQRNAGVALLSAGEVRDANLEPWYRSRNRNTVTVTAVGAPGSSALLLIGDASLIHAGARAALPARTGGLNLDWGE